MPDKNEILSEDQLIADPVKEAEESPALEDQHTVEVPEEEPPLLNTWNQPVQRPKLTPEQESALNRFAQERKLTPEEKLREMILLPPVGFTNFDEKKEEQVKEENTTSEKVEFGPEVPDDPAIAAQMNFLGIKDTPEAGNPIADPNIPIDAPETTADIKQTVNMTTEEIANRAQQQVHTGPAVEKMEQPVNVEEDVVEELTLVDIEALPQDASAEDQENKDIPETPVENDTNSEDVEDIPEMPPVTGDNDSVSNAESRPDTENNRADGENSEGIVESDVSTIAGKEGIVPPVISNNETGTQTVEQSGKDDTSGKLGVSQSHSPTEGIEITEKSDEKNKENEKENDSQTNDLQNALDEFPESDIEVGNNDIEQIETPKEQIPELNLENEEDLMSEENKRNALGIISSIHDAAIFGDEAKEMFTPADLDIKIENDIDPQHMVISNMDTDEILNYVYASDPNGLRRSARRFFNKDTDNDYFRLTMAGIDELDENLRNVTSYPSRVHISNQQFNNPQTEFNKRRLEDAKKEFDEKHPGKEFKMSRAIKIPNKNGDKPIVVDDNFANSKAIFDKIAVGGMARVSDISATKVAAMLVNGFRVVRLYNSGFYVQLAAPRMDILGRYYNACAKDYTSYGRIFGQFAYYPIGVETRSALFDLFEQCVEDSNLENWREPGALRKAVSWLDFPVLTWALASLIYPKGVDIEYLCFNNNDTTGERCRHVEMKKIDINSMRYNNWSRMTTEQVLYCISKETRTLEDLEKYRAKYCKSDGAITPISKNGDWKANFYIPTFHESEMAQRAYIATMAEYVQLDKLTAANQYHMTKQLASLAPFTKEVLYTDPAQNKTLKFDSPDALEKSLDMIQTQADINFIPFMEQYISDRTLTHIAFTYHPCPACEKYPVGAINGLVPCDPEYAFFVWAGSRSRR